jgi:hypothetical protein
MSKFLIVLLGAAALAACAIARTSPAYSPYANAGISAASSAAGGGGGGGGGGM